jgi:hypothetical protein
VSGPGPEFVVVRVRSGELVEAGSWVYVWVDETDRVVYVGATGLDPRTRAWLHVHDPDPEVGRIGAQFGRLTTSQLDVVAMRIPDAVPRAEVRDVVGARLADEALLAEDAITDQLQLALEPADETVEFAERFVARLRSYLEPRDPTLL